MTIAQAEAVAGVRLVEKGGRAGGGVYYYVWSQPKIQDLGFMLISDRSDHRIECQRDHVVRVDVLRDSHVKTV